MRSRLAPVYVDAHTYTLDGPRAAWCRGGWRCAVGSIGPYVEVLARRVLILVTT